MTTADFPAASGLSVRQMAEIARRAGRVLGVLDTKRKNAALLDVAAALRSHAEDILAANASDVAAARAAGLADSLIDRLSLTPDRLEAVAADVENVARLPDPVGETLGEATRPNGLKVSRRRVPLGVLAVIYEARPNVTVDVATLALKSGNAVILRGGKETLQSNAVLVQIIAEALSKHGFPEGAVQVISDPDRARLLELLKLDDLVDAIIPRGGGWPAPFLRGERHGAGHRGRRGRGASVSGRQLRSGRSGRAKCRRDYRQQQGPAPQRL